MAICTHADADQGSARKTCAGLCNVTFSQMHGARPPGTFPGVPITNGYSCDTHPCVFTGWCS